MDDRLTGAEHAELAFDHDRAGEERQALLHYRAALATGLTPELRRECLHGLGSTLRTLGEYQEAYDVLALGAAQFPDRREFPVFQAMAAYNLGRCHEATSLLLTCLADTTNDPNVARYERAIRLYAQDLDRTW